MPNNTDDVAGFTMGGGSTVSPSTVLNVQKKAMHILEGIYNGANDVAMVRLQTDAAAHAEELLKAYTDPKNVNFEAVVRATVIHVLERWLLPIGAF